MTTSPLTSELTDPLTSNTDSAAVSSTDQHRTTQPASVSTITDADDIRTSTAITAHHQTNGTDESSVTRQSRVAETTPAVKLSVTASVSQSMTHRQTTQQTQPVTAGLARESTTTPGNVNSTDKRGGYTSDSNTHNTSTTTTSGPPNVSYTVRSIYF